jgi:hypothetical protein
MAGTARVTAVRAKLISLKLVLVLAIAFAILLVTSTGMIFALTQEASREVAVRGVERDRLAHIVVPLLEKALSAGEVGLVGNILSGINPDGLLDSVTLYPPEGGGYTLRFVVSPRSVNAPSWIHEVFTPAISPARYPLRTGEKSLGELGLQLSHVMIDEAVWVNVKLRSRIVLTLIVVVSLVSWLVLGFAMRPAARIAQAAVRYGEGDRTARVPETAVVEFRPTANAFNRMADNLDLLLAQVATREEQFRAAKDRLDEALVVSKSSIWNTDLVSGTTELSDGWAVLLGRPPLPTVTTTQEVLECVHPDDRDRILAAAVALMKGLSSDTSWSTAFGRTPGNGSG